MVFFTEILPTEIWFKIYKIEHAQNMKKVHDEIRDLNEEILIFNIGVEETLQRTPYGGEKGYNILANLVPYKKCFEFQDFQNLVETERTYGLLRKHFYHRLVQCKIWNLLTYIIMKKNFSFEPIREKTFHTTLLLGKYLWNGPLLPEKDNICSREHNRKTNCFRYYEEY